MFTAIKTLLLALSLLANSFAAPKVAAPTPTSFASNIKIGAVKALPAGTATQSFSGYPGSKWHFGHFANAKEWTAFTQKLRKAPAFRVDWTKQVVAFVVFDAQTNDLAKPTLTRSGNKATINFQWIGIEPFYVDATPAILMIVDKAGLKTIEFRHHKLLGKTTL